MRVNRIMAESFLKREVTNAYLERYMFNYLSIITTVSSILAIKSGTEEHLDMKKQLWADLKALDLPLYRRLRYTVLGIGVNLPGIVGRKLAVVVYKIVQKIYGFN